MAQTKADRSAAAKKAAATRERNQRRDQSHVQGKKAASTRQGRAAENAAGQAVTQVKRAAGGVVGGTKSAVRLAGTAAVEAGTAAASRAGATDRRRKK